MGGMQANPREPVVMPNPDSRQDLSAMYLDHLNKMFAAQRGAVAMGNLNADPLISRPFPGSVQNIKINNFGWPVVGLVALLLAALGYFFFWPKKETDPTPPPQPPAVVCPPEDTTTTPAKKSLGVRIKYWVEPSGEVQFDKPQEEK